LHFQYEEEPPSGRRRGVVGGPAMLSAEVNRDDLAARQIQMASSLLTGRTQRRSLASSSLSDEHVSRTEALASHSRRGSRLPPGKRTAAAGAVAAEAVEGDVDRLASAYCHT